MCLFCRLFSAFRLMFGLFRSFSQLQYLRQGNTEGYFKLLTWIIHPGEFLSLSGFSVCFLFPLSLCLYHFSSPFIHLLAEQAAETYYSLMVKDRTACACSMVGYHLGLFLGFDSCWREIERSRESLRVQRMEYEKKENAEHHCHNFT